MTTDLYIKLAKIFVPIGILIGVYFYGHHKGYEEYDLKVIAERLAEKEKEAKQVTDQSKVNDKVVTRYIDVIRNIDKSTPTIVEEIKKEAKNENAACKLSVGTIRLYDDSNRVQDARTTESSVGKAN